MKPNEIIGKKIKHIRTQKNISQETLAKSADVTTNYIGQIERGQRNPTLSILESISTALGIPLCDLFNDIDNTIYESSKCTSQMAEIILLLESLNTDQLNHIHVIIKEINNMISK